MKNLIVMSICMALITVSANANLLVDPGFELNPLDTATNVLNNFSTYQGIWGVENATIVTAENGVTPIQGVQMLHMDNTGSYTQGFQVTDVTSYAALIDSGNAVVNMSAQFNVDKAVPAALGVLGVSFFTGNTYGTLTTYFTNSLTLDNSNNTWELISGSSAIPVGTRWLVSQVAYQDATLLGIDGVYHPGYVDAADMTITQVPEPATLGLLILGGLAMRCKRKGFSR
jgi:hypothetical protein